MSCLHCHVMYALLIILIPYFYFFSKNVLDEGTGHGGCYLHYCFITILDFAFCLVINISAGFLTAIRSDSPDEWEQGWISGIISSLNWIFYCPGIMYGAYLVELKPIELDLYMLDGIVIIFIFRTCFCCHVSYFHF